jgi:hypothetical protein
VKYFHVIPEHRLLFSYDQEDRSYEAIVLSVQSLKRLAYEIERTLTIHDKPETPVFSIIPAEPEKKKGRGVNK